MKKSIRAAAAALLIPILLALTGCSLTVDSVMSVIAPTETPVPGSDLVFSDQPEATPEPRQITYEKMDGVFSPFFAETDGDKAVSKMTQLSLRAVEGNRAPAEITRTTGSDGTASVTIRLQKGLRCADGAELTADDLLFTYYVLMDESYEGPYTINRLPIDGIALYWNGMDSDMYGKYMMIYDEIYNGGKYEADLEKAVEDARRAAVEKGVSEENADQDADVVKAQQALDEYDTVRADEIRDAIDNAWRNDAQALVDYTMENYSGTIALRTPYTREEVLANTGLQVAYTMLDRGFGKFTDGGGFASTSGRTWDLTAEFPTAEDLYDEMFEAYDGDVAQYWSIEGIGRADMLAAVQNSLVREWAPLDDDWRGGVQSVSGVEKLDDLTIRISLTRCADTILQALTEIPVAPLQIYGDVSLFDPENDSFGFTKGDLSSVRANNGKAVGAGEYVYRETDISTVYLDANENYWLGVTEVPEVILTKAG